VCIRQVPNSSLVVAIDLENAGDEISARFMPSRISNPTDRVSEQNVTVAQRLGFIVRLEREKTTCDYLAMSSFPVPNRETTFLEA
jgi:hypothetical protein